jgi:hypothetical protein
MIGSLGSTAARVVLLRAEAVTVIDVTPSVWVAAGYRTLWIDLKGTKKRAQAFPLPPVLPPAASCSGGTTTGH